ncbi:MAG TPA: hypothetical protein VHO70_17740 [Chitinispirillaceae bacterium]|nr:hypothetical protein [Chitinispirillaceae bacterium]
MIDSQTTALKNGYEKGTNDKKMELAENLDKWNRDYARYSRSIYGDLGCTARVPVCFGTIAGGNIVMADRKYDVTKKVMQDLNEH